MTQPTVASRARAFGPCSREHGPGPLERSRCFRHLTLSLGALLLGVTTATAQLRPMDPVEWHLLEVEGQRFGVSVGMGVYSDQRAPLAGTIGRLVEIGTFRGIWVRGAVAIQVSGTALRVFEDERAFAEPYGLARASAGEGRVDAGDQRVSTIIVLTPDEGDLDFAVRFGVTLPTTDNRAGPERDQTDVFATLGGRLLRGGLMFSAEVGLGVHGTRDPDHEQVDPILFAAGLRGTLDWIQWDLQAVGQHDPRGNADLRGNEDLGEVRLGVRRGERRWVRLAAVRGWETFSPGLGLLVEGGFSF